MLNALWLSLFSYRLTDPGAREFVGLRNYGEILSDPVFLGVVLPNTLLLMVGSVLLSLVGGLALAHLLYRQFPGRWLLQTVILLPLMIAPVIAATMMRWTFNDQFGVVAALLNFIGYGQISWLAERWPHGPALGAPAALRSKHAARRLREWPAGTTLHRQCRQMCVSVTAPEAARSQATPPRLGRVGAALTPRTGVPHPANSAS